MFFPSCIRWRAPQLRDKQIGNRLKFQGMIPPEHTVVHLGLPDTPRGSIDLSDYLNVDDNVAVVAGVVENESGDQYDEVKEISASKITLTIF